MKLKEDLKLRKVGSRYMLVDVSDHDANVTNVHTLNDTAAFVWNAAMKHGVDVEALAAQLCAEYEVTPAEALEDVRRLIASWRESGIVTD